MAKSAASRMRGIGIGQTAANWSQRASICEMCPMRVVRGGVSYCGTPFLKMIDRDPLIDGCGCPTREKAKSPGEHCPIDRSFKLPVMNSAGCSCRWCESSAVCKLK